MIKWLEKFKLKFKHSKKLEKLEKSPVQDQPFSPFCLEVRVDEKGIVYSPTPVDLDFQLDYAAYSQICQAVSSIALMEMCDKRRVIH